MWDKIMDEPVLVYNLVNVALVAAATFGLDLSSEQIVALLAVTTAVLNIIARGKVVPTRKLNGK
jgi:hypothetical protein